MRESNRVIQIFSSLDIKFSNHMKTIYHSNRGYAEYGGIIFLSKIDLSQR